MQPLTELSVFIASPSDVREERDAIERIVKELNLTIAAGSNACLNLVRWETHVRPGIATDLQQGINAQVGVAHDVVIGVFWGRVGTPTPRAGSGTLEELEASIARWQADSTSVEVMIYFKDDGIPPSQSNADQLAKLTQFRESLSERGVLYKTLLGKEFESLVRIDLARATMNILGRNTSSALDKLRTDPPIVALTDASPTQFDEDEGIEDLLLKAGADLAQAAASMERLAALNTEQASHFSKHDDELSGPNRSVAIEGIADGLQVYAERLAQETGQLSFYQERALSAFARSVLMAAEDGALSENDRINTLPIVQQSSETLTSFCETLMKTRQQLAKMPRLTRKLNIAKRNAGDAIDSLQSKLETAQRMHASLEDALKKRD